MSHDNEDDGQGFQQQLEQEQQEKTNGNKTGKARIRRHSRQTIRDRGVEDIAIPYDAPDIHDLYQNFSEIRDRSRDGDEYS